MLLGIGIGMKTLLKPFALCAAISVPNAAFTEELTSDDYPPARPATLEEIQEHCNVEDNPNEEASLLSVTPGEEYPFEIIFCQPAHVSPYKCSTLSNLVNFEFDIRSLLRESGTELERDNKIVGQFTNLYEDYDKHCQLLLY